MATDGLAVVRVLAYAILGPTCVALAMDRWNLHRRASAVFFLALGLFFVMALLSNVLDLAGAKEAVRLARMAMTPAAVFAAVSGVSVVIGRLRE